MQVTLNSGGTRTLRGERVFINIGTRATIPAVPGLADSRPMTHVEALNLERVPSHLVILGGGYVGLEFAQGMRRFGSRVTVIQRGPRLLDREDPDVTDALQELLTDEGVEVLVQSEVLSVTGNSGTGVSLKVRSGTQTEQSKPPTSWWPSAEHRTPTGWIWPGPGSNSIRGVTSA